MQINNNSINNKINFNKIHQKWQVVKIIHLLINKILNLCNIQIHFNYLKTPLKLCINFKSLKKKIKIKSRIILKIIISK